MKQSVHGLCRNHAVFRELVILHLPEFPVKGFSVAHLVRTFLLNQMKQTLCQLQSLPVPGRFVIGRKSVDGKGLVVGMLRRILRLPIIPERPEHAAVFFVNAALPQKSIAMSRLPKKAFILKERIGVREKPENAAV